MSPWQAVAVVLAVVGVAALLGAVSRRRSGRARPVADDRVVDIAELPGGVSAAPAMLLQFSTDYCGACPGTRRLLAQVAEERAGLRHLDVDLTRRPDLAKRFRILQTPTVLVLDADRRLVRRFGGAPRRDELDAVLDDLVPRHGRGR